MVLYCSVKSCCYYYLFLLPGVDIIPQVIKKIRREKIYHVERLCLLQVRHNECTTKRNGVKALDVTESCYYYYYGI